MNDIEMYIDDILRSVHKNIKRIDSNLIRVHNMLPSEEKSNMLKKIYEEVSESKEELEKIVKEI